MAESDASHELKVASHDHELLFAEQLESITEESAGFGEINRFWSIVAHRVLTHQVEVRFVSAKDDHSNLQFQVANQGNSNLCEKHCSHHYGIT